MTGQVVVYISTLLTVLTIAYVINVCIQSKLPQIGIRRLGWHGSIFDTAIYALVVSVIILISSQFLL